MNIIYYIPLLVCFGILILVVYLSFKKGSSQSFQIKEKILNGGGVRCGTIMLREEERRRMAVNKGTLKVGGERFGRMTGSFGRYGYDITNPIVTDDLYKYLGTAVYKGGLEIEDASPICGYKISLFKIPVFHTAVKVEGETLPILLYFVKGETNSRFYPRDFFSGIISDLVKKGISPQLRDNTEECLLLDAEENEGGTYKIEKVIRLKDSYIGKNWKQFAKDYKPMKVSAPIPPDVYSAMLRTNKMLCEKARVKKQESVDPKPKCPIQEDGESDEAYMERVNEYVKADTEWRKRNQV